MDTGDAKAANLPDGSRLGKIIKARGRVSATVTDENAFVAWVIATHPDQIEPAVRSAYRERVLGAARSHGAAVDVESGELIPGIEVRQGEPYISVRGETTCTRSSPTAGGTWSRRSCSGTTDE